MLTGLPPNLSQKIKNKIPLESRSNKNQEAAKYGYKLLSKMWKQMTCDIYWQNPDMARDIAKVDFHVFQLTYNKTPVTISSSLW